MSKAESKTNLNDRFSIWPIGEFINIEYFSQTCPEIVKLAQTTVSKNGNWKNAKEEMNISMDRKRWSCILGIKNQHGYILLIPTENLSKILSSREIRKTLSEQQNQKTTEHIVELEKQPVQLKFGDQIVLYDSEKPGKLSTVPCLPSALVYHIVLRGHSSDYALVKSTLNDIHYYWTTNEKHFMGDLHANDDELDLLALISVFHRRVEVKKILEVEALMKTELEIKAIYGVTTNDCLGFCLSCAKEIAIDNDISEEEIKEFFKNKTVFQNAYGWIEVSSAFVEGTSRENRLSAESATVSSTLLRISNVL